MAVHQVEEYYVFIKFKKVLNNEQRREVLNYLQNNDCDYRFSILSLDVCFSIDKIAAYKFDVSFSEKFSNLIK